MKEKHFRKNKGITLIALIVTIIVLLILAGISIIMLTGQNGILNRAGEAKEKTGIAQIDESVKLAVADALTKGTGGITKTNLEEALNKYVGEGNYGLSDVTDGWKISAGGKRYNVTSRGGISEEDNSKTPSIGEIYSEPGITEDDIAPADIFSYKILDEEAKTAAITKINVECSVLERVDQRYTYYGFNRDDVTDTLVVPYEYTSDEGKKYTIVEACVKAIYCDYENNNNISNFIPNNIKTIIFPNTITKLKDIYDKSANSSAPNKSLKKVIFPNKLQKVGGFSSCESMISFELPETVTEISAYAFYGCNKMSTIQIPDNVKTIEKSAFYYCTSIQQITFSSNIERLGDDAFYGCEEIREITIPKNIKQLGSGVFMFCSNLEKVIIENGIQEIPDWTFYYCKNLSEIQIPNNITAIGYRAFMGCTSINEITIPGSVTTIGEKVFGEWNKNQTVNIPITEEVAKERWGNYWKSDCNAEIKYAESQQ